MGGRLLDASSAPQPPPLSPGHDDCPGNAVAHRLLGLDEICPATLLAPRPACPDGGYSALRPPYAGPAALPGVLDLLERRPTARPAFG
ncbi:hypothetical protein ACWGUI_22695, partial [Streptomyces anthocyanicus]